MNRSRGRREYPDERGGEREGVSHRRTAGGCCRHPPHSTCSVQELGCSGVVHDNHDDDVHDKKRSGIK